MQQTKTDSPPYEQLREIIDNIPNLAWSCGPDGQDYWCNKQWYDYTGTTHADMQAGGWQKVIDPKNLEAVVDRMDIARKSGEPLEMVWSLLAADGSSRPFITRMVPLKNCENSVLRWLGTATDISQQIDAEQELRQSERRRQAIFDAVIDMITVFDMQGNVVLMNMSAAAVYGIQGHDDILEGLGHASNVYEMYYPDGRKCPLSDWPISRIYRGETLDDYELMGRRENPYIERYLSFTGSLMKDDDGKPQYAVVVTRDVTDRKKAEEEEKKLAALSRERNELIRLNKAKDDFISIASHQLRTPATAVKQYIGILQSGIGGELTPEQQQFLTVAYESNERQLKLINDLLRIAQIDASGFALDQRKYDLHKLIKEVVRDLEPTTSQSGQQINLHGLDSPAVLLLDATEMKVAMANIIENASKYSPPKSVIDISSRKTKKQVTITVKDHGMGIAKKDVRKIFDKFSRVNSKPYDTVSGTGLGLYLVKQTVELHGGKISVVSAPGQGSEFKILLPL